MRVRAYRIRAGSGGAGQFTGGDGIVRELEFLEEADVTILSDRRGRGPWGLAGGESGAPGHNEVSGIAVPAKTRITIPRHGRLRIESPGGGGWGPK